MHGEPSRKEQIMPWSAWLLLGFPLIGLAVLSLALLHDELVYHH